MLERLKDVHRLSFEEARALREEIVALADEGTIHLDDVLFDPELGPLMRELENRSQIYVVCPRAWQALMAGVPLRGSFYDRSGTRYDFVVEKTTDEPGYIAKVREPATFPEFSPFSVRFVAAKDLAREPVMEILREAHLETWVLRVTRGRTVYETETVRVVECTPV